MKGREACVLAWEAGLLSELPSHLGCFKGATQSVLGLLEDLAEKIEVRCLR